MMFQKWVKEYMINKANEIKSKFPISNDVSYKFKKHPDGYCITFYRLHPRVQLIHRTVEKYKDNIGVED